MNEEIQALESNNTWHLTTLPKGKKAIGCKWVYRVKRNSEGDVDRFEARMVAKGYLQVEGEYYTEVFSPVAKLVQNSNCSSYSTTMAHTPDGHQQCFPTRLH